MSLTSRDSQVAQQINALADLPREELSSMWVKAHGISPPKGISRRLLELSAASAIQAKLLGGLSRASRHQLRILSDGNGSRKGTADRLARTTLQPGVRLVREWNGQTHHVEVLDCGFSWNGRRWRSLSAIAREITGARWSGQRFFGL